MMQPSAAGSTYPRSRRPRRGTYSIVARDAATGAIGIAVQSHWFSVGSLVSAASAGVGGIATQAFPDVQHKPKALALLRQGRSAAEVSEALLEEAAPQTTASSRWSTRPAGPSATPVPPACGMRAT